MPAYDYRCPDCSHRFEVNRPMGSSEPVQCPLCDSPCKRVFSPVGVAFKGTGFHNTDYRPRPSEDGAGCAAKSGSSACATCPAATGSSGSSDA